MCPDVRSNKHCSAARLVNTLRELRATIRLRTMSAIGAEMKVKADVNVGAKACNLEHVEDGDDEKVGGTIAAIKGALADENVFSSCAKNLAVVFRCRPGLNEIQNFCGHVHRC